MAEGEEEGKNLDSIWNWVMAEFPVKDIVQVMIADLESIEVATTFSGLSGGSRNRTRNRDKCE